MTNWKLINDSELYDSAWNFIYERLKFSPRGFENDIINLPNPHETYDLDQFYGDNFNETLYDELHEHSIKVFQDITDGEMMIALNWQHDCYIFDPLKSFERDEFDEWLIPVFPNGDYVFFITEDFNNVMFCDGINQNISLYGDNIIQAFKKIKPRFFVG